jgi:hypothetical protein
MKRKCKRCGKRRNIDYEYAREGKQQCVFCDDEDRKNKLVTLK